MVWKTLRDALAAASHTKRLVLASAGLIVTVVVVVAVAGLVLNQLLKDKVFLASLLVLLGALKEAFSRLVNSQGSRLLASVDAYPGSKYEYRLAARDRDVKFLEDISFYSLLVVLTAVAFLKAVTEGGAE